MPVWTNGNSVIPWTNGNALNGRFIGGINYLGTQANNPFTEALAGLEFSITTGGVVTLTVELGAIISSTYHNGQILGPNLVRDVDRTNVVVVRAPATGYSNSGETITITREFTQPRLIVPTPTDPTPDPDPVRNTFSDWSNSGNPYNDTTVSTTGAFSAWATIDTPESERFLNEQRCRTLTTTTRNLQDQTRTCTAAGGCDGGAANLMRTVVIGSAFSASRDCETRNTNHDGASGVVNPDYRPTITFSDFNASCPISRADGSISLEVFYRGNNAGEPIFIPDSNIIITSPSSGSFPVIPFGSSREPRNVSYTVTNWSVPLSANAANTNALISGSGTCETIQLPANAVAFVPNVTVRNNNRIVTSITNGQRVQMEPGLEYFIGANGRLSADTPDGIEPTNQGNDHIIDFSNGTQWTITVVSSSNPMNPSQTAFGGFRP